MKVTKFTRKVLAARRQRRDLLARGYREFECDWEINRGGRRDEAIIDVVIANDGKSVYTKLGKPGEFDRVSTDDRKKSA